MKELIKPDTQEEQFEEIEYYDEGGDECKWGSFYIRRMPDDGDIIF